MFELRDTNETYGNKLLDLAKKYPQLVVLEADLGKASGSEVFYNAHPDRYYNFGVAEQNMVGFAAGLASIGKIPFASTFACFLSQRACDQVVNSVAYNRQNVKLIGTYAGLTSEKNGGTHISVADIAIIRAIPHMVIMDAGDAVELEQILEFAAGYDGPVYIRTNKGKYPVFHDSQYRYEFNKAEVLSKGTDVGLITTGLTTFQGLEAVKELKELGISVYHLHMPTIKPIDKSAIAECMNATGWIVTAENHSVIGGLGMAVAAVSTETVPGKVTRLGLADCFGETATLDYMMAKHCIDTAGIVKTIRSGLSSK